MKPSVCYLGGKRGDHEDRHLSDQLVGVFKAQDAEETEEKPSRF